MIKEIKEHINILISILAVIGIFIYLSNRKNNIDFMLDIYNKKIDSLNILIKESQINKDSLYYRLDSLSNKKSSIINKFYNDIKVYENINNSDSLISIIREQFQMLGSPKFN